MYHEDRLSGASFARVWLSGASLAAGETNRARREIGDRLGVAAETVDVRPAAELRDRLSADPEVLDTLAAPVGVLIRNRAPGLNLSSRPFYNERLVSGGIALVALLALAVGAFNVYTLSALSRDRAALKARIAADTAQAQQIEREALGLQRSVDRAMLVQLAQSTREANALIDQRTFSWTVFFGLIEKTLPFDLRLVRVTPRPEAGNVRVTIRVVGRRLEDIDAFMDALQETGAFYDLFANNKERVEDDDTYRADIVAYYLAPTTPGPAAPAAAEVPEKGRP
jgi:hypothetical protein